MISLNVCLMLAALLFGIGIAGVIINCRHLILMLMSLELMLLGVNTNFIAFSYWQQNHTGQIMVFFVIATAAAEAALGLALVVLLYRNQQSLAIAELNTLQG